MTSTKRLPSERGFVDPSKLPRGPHGRALCRQCSTEVPLGSRTFCSNACVSAWRSVTDPSHQRMLVAARDGGVCAICSIDTEELRRWREHAFTTGLSRYVWPRSAYFPDGPPEHAEQIVGFMRASDAYAPSYRYVFWDMDHVVPVVEGGGECDLSNLRTLCIPCHKGETKRLAGRRAAARRAAKKTEAA